MQLLSINTIMIIGGVLLVVLILLIILMVASNKKSDSVVKQAEYNYNQNKNNQQLRDGELHMRATDHANADSLFPDENFARLVAATLNVRTSDPLDEQKLLQIKRLDGTAKDIKNLQGIEHLRNLEVANLGSNKLTSLPKEIKSLDKLQELKIDNNAIHDVSPITENQSLRMLDISDNDIEYLPNDIFALPNLEKFSAQRNRIHHLSNEMNSSPRLRELDLSQNALRVLPSSIENMSELSSLNLAGNQLTQIPLEVGNLAKMKQLDVTRNDDLVVPDVLKQKLIARSVQIREDDNEREFVMSPLESYEGVSFGETEVADEGGLEEMKNTYIDLTNSHDDLLFEIAALEKSLSDTTPIVNTPDSNKNRMQSPKRPPESEMNSQSNSISDRVSLLDKTKQNESAKYDFQEQQSINGGLTQQMGLSPQQLTEAEIKKQKRKKILKIAGMVAGATVAAVTITGTSIYFLNRKNPSKRKRRSKKNNFYFNKKRR